MYSFKGSLIGIVATNKIRVSIECEYFGIQDIIVSLHGILDQDKNTISYDEAMVMLEAFFRNYRNLVVNTVDLGEFDITSKEFNGVVFLDPSHAKSLNRMMIESGYFKVIN